MSIVNPIVTAFVFSGLLISVPTSAAPDGSLREMLDTNITLIEYITLQTAITSVERLAERDVTKWGDYSSVVRMHVNFDYEDSELTFWLNPRDDHYFSTIAEAKLYCRDLIRAERFDIWLELFFNATPSGWTRGGLDADEFNEQLYESTKIGTVVSRDQIEEKLPEEEYSLRCEASLDDEGQITNFSYNL